MGLHLAILLANSQGGRDYRRIMLKDKRQRVVSYISHTGIEVYEIEQYNQVCDTWFIVGDCDTNLDYVEYKVYNHNMSL